MNKVNVKRTEEPKDLCNYEYFRPFIEGTVVMRWINRLAKRVPAVIFVLPLGKIYPTHNDKLVLTYFSWMFLKIGFLIYLAIGAVIGLYKGYFEYIYLLLIPIIWFPNLEFLKKFRENPYPLFYTRWVAAALTIYVWYHFYG